MSKVNSDPKAWLYVRKATAIASSAEAKQRNSRRLRVAIMTAHRLDPRRAGVGLRLPHLAEMVATRPSVGWLEIHPENFLANPHATELLADLSRDYPISIHTVGVSVGSASEAHRAVAR